MATKTYVCVGQHAITPTAEGTVAPGDKVPLDPQAAAFYLEAGQLVEAPAAPPAAPDPPADTKAADTSTKTAKETDQ